MAFRCGSLLHSTSADVRFSSDDVIPHSVKGNAHRPVEELAMCTAIAARVPRGEGEYTHTHARHILASYTATVHDSYTV